MSLNFEMSRSISLYSKIDKTIHDGLVLVTLDSEKVASFTSINKVQKLEINQMFLQYRIRGGKVKFATNAFFFQEGTGKLYENAKFGKFKVNAKHELLLVSLHDKNLTKI